MKYLFQTAGKKLRFRFVIGTDSTAVVPMKIRVYDANKESGAVYLDANVPLNDKTLPTGKSNPREVFVQLPLTPQAVIIQIYNQDNGDRAEGVDTSFKILKRDSSPLKQNLQCIGGWNIAFDFMKFVQIFAQEAKWRSATLQPGFPQGTPSSYCYYYKPGKAFQIDYYDDLRDTNPFRYDPVTRNVLIDASGQKVKNTNYGNIIATPARIHETTGIIEVSKNQMKKYTVPMIIAILVHEYSHVFRNREMRNETEADINGLKLYLSYGFPSYEAKQAFLKVFIGTPTDTNVERHHVIDKFIDNWDNYVKNCA